MSQAGGHLSGRGRRLSEMLLNGEPEQAVVRRETLAPEGSFAVSNRSLPDGDLRVSATTTAGQSGTLDWSRVDERSTLDVRVVDNGVQFTELD